jgi:hypothetical protein
MVPVKELLLLSSFVISNKVCGNIIYAASRVSKFNFLLLRFYYSMLAATLVFLFSFFYNEIVNVFIYNSFYFGVLFQLYLHNSSVFCNKVYNIFKFYFKSEVCRWVYLI